jgi:hypothetical protein
MLAAAGSVAILAGGMALAGSASAASLPSCATGVNCVDNSAGLAGYYGADDNHTHYRYVQTVVSATPQLVNLNGNDSNNFQGGVGVELCDPNDFGYQTGDLSGDFAAQIALSYTSSGYEVRYNVGFFAPAADPCVSNGFTQLQFQHGQPLIESGINPGDTLSLAIYYTPGGRHFHQISFGVCDENTGICRQAYNNSPVAVNFWEFGIGGFANSVTVTGGAINPSESFADNDVTCYSCTHSVPINDVQPVNTLGVGGLTEAQWVNLTSQPQLTPKDSLEANSSFTLYEGSTSP